MAKCQIFRTVDSALFLASQAFRVIILKRYIAALTKLSKPIFFAGEASSTTFSCFFNSGLMEEVPSYQKQTIEFVSDLKLTGSVVSSHDMFLFMLLLWNEDMFCLC